jgi:outer membrane protein assembly factor BamB
VGDRGPRPAQQPDGSVRAVGTDDWTERWRRSPSEGARAPGGVADGSLYLAGTGRVRALTAGGDERWAVDHHGTLQDAVGDEWLEDSPSLFGPHVVPTPDRLYAVSAYGFHGLAPADGTERWRVVFPDAPRSRPDGAAVTGDAVWTASGGRLFRLATGGGGSAALTAARLPTGSVHPPAVTPAGALLTPRGGTTRPPYTLAAYGAGSPGPAGDPPAPSPAWRVTLHPDRDGEVYGITRPAVAGDRVVVGEAVATATDGGRRQVAAVAALDAATGERAWRHDRPAADPDGRTAATGRLLSDPVVAGGTVLVGVGTRRNGSETLVPEPGAVVALDATTGEQRWRVESEVAPQRLTVAGEYCYVADDEGRVAALG